ncbi:hypothetical protein CHARACLAT_003855 [Characodon lateralis]|uniref:Uncharacterized protein n=1 Tax=Characodon lateralis TaxID=208331 RepID=A0ABU7EQQ2_9TELE|nr:hypothetical protein [Characodon lateralis]
MFLTAFLPHILASSTLCSLSSSSSSSSLRRSPRPSGLLHFSPSAAHRGGDSKVTVRPAESDSYRTYAGFTGRCSWFIELLLNVLAAGRLQERGIMIIFV